MRTIALIFGIFLVFNLSAQTFEWAYTPSNDYNSGEYATDVVADHSGNVYITGSFNSPDITIGTETFSNSGQYDFYIAKLSPDGDVLWAKSYGGLYTDMPTCIIYDAGILYVSGIFDSDSLMLGSIVLQSQGERNIFLMQLDSTGQEINAVSGYSITNFSIGIVEMITDQNGDIYYTGSFGQEITFGDTTLYSSGSSDFFLGKMNHYLERDWVIKSYSSFSAGIRGIDLDVEDNVYIAGSSGDTLIFSGDTLVNSMGNISFIFKLDSEGNRLNIIRCDTVSNFTDIKVDSHNNVFAIGHYDVGIGIGTQYGGSCLIKYDSLGNQQWYRDVGEEPHNSRAIEIQINEDNDVYLTGDFRVYPLEMTEFTMEPFLTFYNHSDVYVLRFNNDGEVTGYTKLGAEGEENVNALCQSTNNTLYVFGKFNSPIIDIASSSIYNYKPFQHWEHSSGWYINTNYQFFLTKLNFILDDIAPVPNDSFVVYPNPSNGNFSIQSDETIDLINIYNSNGSLICSEKVSNSKHKMNIELSSGLYFIQVESNGIISTEKLFIE